MKLKPHPLAELFPLLEGKPFEELCKSLERDGQLEDIITLDGKILDGRNRYNGLLHIKAEPRITEYNGTNPAAFVWAKNGQRRHLTASQLAAIGAEIAIHIREEAKEADEPVTGDSAAQAAEAVGVSPRAVKAALAIKKKSPAKFAKIRKGEMTVNEVQEQDKAKAEKARKEKEEQENAEDIKRIGKICGMTFSQAVMKGTILKTRAEVKRFADLEDEEMERIKLLVQQGWAVTKAKKYQMTGLTRAHRIKDLLDRAAAQGGKFELNIEGWTVKVAKQ